MPIKCAGAPQKAMYLVGRPLAPRSGVLGRTSSIDFCNAGAVLFGVQDYVPALMEYVERYGIQLDFQADADGGGRAGAHAPGSPAPAPTARPSRSSGASTCSTSCRRRRRPTSSARSPLADAAGWLDVDQARSATRAIPNIFGLGDACYAPNAKTAAAARKQAPIVAHNLLRDAGRGAGGDALYDGYGSCPLTVERGNIVLAEFGYGGKLLPSFPAWLIDGRRPSRLAWLLKERMLPWVYWKAMLRGREWLAQPELTA